MAHEEDLEWVEVFKYLGRLMTCNNNYSHTMQSNLKKARKSWARVSCVLRVENASPKVCGVFYEATVKAFLLLGSETWKLSPLSLKSLEGFHIRSTYCMAGMQPTWNPDGMWEYLSSKDVLKAVGLKMIDHYIGVCCDTIARFIMDQPLFVLSWDGKRRRGSVCCTLWWEQPLSLDLMESLPGDKENEGDDNHLLL